MTLTHFDNNLLRAAIAMPEAGELLKHIEVIRDLSEACLRLTIDRETFTAAVLRVWYRNNVKGIMLEPIALASIIEGAANLRLTHPQRLRLRADIEAMNVKMFARLAEEQDA